MTGSPWMFCEHANEVPHGPCTCSLDCACRARMCPIVVQSPPDTPELRARLARQRHVIMPAEDVVEVTIYAKHADLIPTRGTKRSTGLDLRASETAIVLGGRTRRVPTGVSLHVRAPDDVETLDIQARGRSGMATRGHFLHVGTVDLDYRGPMDVIVFNSTRYDMRISPGDRVGQLVIPTVAAGAGRFLHVCVRTEIGVAPVDTERGAGGYGSTGR